MDIDTIDFLDPATQENPFASYDALLAQAPVHFMPSIQAYVVSSHAAIRHVVTHPAIWSIDFRARPDAQLIKTPRARALLEAEGFPRDTKLTTDPPAHTAYRAAVAKAFMPARVAAQRAFIAGVVDELVQGLRGRTQCEFMRDVAWTLPMRVVTRLLGVPAEDADRIKHWSDVWVEPLAYGLSEERELYVAQEEIALQKYLVAHMQSKLDNPGEDILTELANARMADGSPMSLADKVGLAEHLIVGGHETATSALGSGMMIPRSAQTSPQRCARIPHGWSVLSKKCCGSNPRARGFSAWRCRMPNSRACTFPRAPWCICALPQPTATHRSSSGRQNST